VEKDRRKGL